MKCMVDTSAFLAVALDEPEKAWLVEATKGCVLAAPAVLPYEIGNALSAMVKRKSILASEAAAVWDTIARIPIELTDFDVKAALLLAARCGLYAYDAYYLQCAMVTRCPLLTLDRGMKHTARELHITLLEQA